MTTESAVPVSDRPPELLGQTVVEIGGSAGIGLETARRARAAAFDATDPAALERFFGDLPAPVGHVMVTAGAPYYTRLADLDRARAHRDFDEHLWLAVEVARHSVGRVRPGGTLLFMGGTGGRRPGAGMAWRWKWRPSGSISRSAASSGPPTSPRSRCTS